MNKSVFPWEANSTLLYGSNVCRVEILRALAVMTKSVLNTTNEFLVRSDLCPFLSKCCAWAAFSLL